MNVYHSHSRNKWENIAEQSRQPFGFSVVFSYVPWACVWISFFSTGGGSYQCDHHTQASIFFFFFKPSLSVNKHTTADVRNAIKKQYIRDAASSLKKKNNNTHIIYRREVVWKQSCGCQGGPRLCRPWTHKYDLLVTVGLGFFFFFFPPHMQQPLCHLDKYHPTSLSLFFFL